MPYNQWETEQINGDSLDLDRMSSLEIVRLMNEEDKTVAYAVEKQLPRIAEAVDLIVDSLENGGKLYYFGAGTSGRLGILDASECPPTFGTEPELVQAVIAGGPEAIVRAVEGAEDDYEMGVRDVMARGVRKGDVVVGIAASGRTPYVKGAMHQAHRSGARIIFLSCNSHSEMSGIANVTINVVVGPEILAGSTRLKAGTAQKMVLNMLTTASMIRLGKVYRNLMVNVQATNSKLRERAKNIIMEVTNVGYEEAEKLMEASGGDVKLAIIMKLKGVDLETAKRWIRQTNGRLRDVLERSESG